MITMIIVLWWLSGFVPLLIGCKIKEGKVTVADLGIAIIMSVTGLIIASYVVYLLTKDLDFWDKKIF